MAKFITFDGIDGSGKSTQIEMLADYLKQKGQEIYITREIGGCEIAEDIRDLLLDPQKNITPLSEMLMVFAARAEHLEKVIKPKIKQGTWVICSRFTDATLAYQGYGRNILLDKIKQLADIVHKDFNPDISFFLDLDVKKAAKRRDKRGEFVDRFELEHISFMQKVRDGYLQIAKDDTANRCVLISADQPLEEIFQQIKSQIDNLL